MKYWQRIGLIVVLVLLLGGLYYWGITGLFQLKSFEFHRWLGNVPTWQAIGVIMSMTIADIIIPPLQGGWLNVSYTFLYGAWLGSSYFFIASSVGHAIAFGLSRWLIAPLFTQPLNYNEKIYQLRVELGALYAIPLFPAEVLTWLIGATNLSWKRFAIILVPGILLRAVLAQVFGVYIVFVASGITMTIALGLILVIMITHWLINQHRSTE
ncbi:MAG: hypothetical protein HYV33_04390 [Candidatus Kerfeldbacteria bacterium]|nr:hypothetical protein [Candidatus Kerfeldbacteria bacterium]